jgi:hypothetical protein
MKTVEDIVQNLQETIANIYVCPAMYGLSVAEVEQSLWIYHRTWAFAADRLDEFFRQLAELSDTVGCEADSLNHFYRKSHPIENEQQVLQFVLEHWATVTVHFGIARPATYPDPAFCNFPYTE